MKTKTSILFIVILSILSLLSLNAFSVNEDFIAVAENATINVCSCEIAENIIKIGNTGDINSLYSITQEGTASKWTTIMPKSFSLEEKRTKELMNPINVPCDAKKGNYELTTYIETGFGMNKAIKQNIAVMECEKEEPNNQTTDKEEYQAEDQNKGSKIMNVLKWTAYITVGFILAIIIIIAVIYRSEADDEPNLGKDPKAAKKAAKSSSKNKKKSKKTKAAKKSKRK